MQKAVADGSPASSNPVAQPHVRGGVSHDAAYAELYSEMRRYRDYEFQTASWYMAMLLAILGFLVTVRFGPSAPELATLLTTSWWPGAALSLGAAFIAYAAWAITTHCSDRYHELREFVTEKMEPPIKKSFKPTKRLVTPDKIHAVTPWVLALLIGILAWSPVPPKVDPAAVAIPDRPSAAKASPARTVDSAPEGQSE